MSSQTWAQLDAYIGEHLLADADPVFADVLRANAAAGLRAIDVSPAQGKFLHLLVTISGARKVLEIGTLGGYSAIWMASALPEGGRLITLEYEQHHADVAQANVARAGLTERIDIRVGAALETLPSLREEAPFDLIFIDADKPNNPAYLQWSLKLSRPGTVIMLDNVAREGHVLDAGSNDPNVSGTRAAFELLKKERRIDATALQTVGIKGWDGFVVGVVRPT